MPPQGHHAGLQSPLFGTPSYVSLHLAVDLSFNILYDDTGHLKWKMGFLSSMSCSSKLIKPKKRVVGTLRIYSQS